MLVSAILIAILLAGGYALYLWLRQQRGGRDPMPGRRSLTPERDKNIQPIELTSKRKNNRPIDPLASLPGGSDELLQPRSSRPDPSGRHDPMRTEQMTAPPAMTGAVPAVGQRTASSASHPRPVPEMTAALGEQVLRERAKTQPEVVVGTGAPQRRVRRRDPTMQISADELATITIDDEGTTLGVELRADRDNRGRVSMQSEFDLSIEVALPGDGDDEPSGPFIPVAVAAAGATDVGKKRKHNEDAIAIDHERSVYVLADGMGGYAAGEVASQMCVDTILRAYQTNAFGGEAIAGLPPRGDELVRAIQTANHDILTESRANEARAGMGTTVVAVRMVPGKQRAYIAHVGDSRLYRLRKDELVQMTADHTLGAQGVTGPAAQKLSRAVGVFDEVEVDLNIDVPEPGDVYLICSDGLFKMVHEQRIVEILSEQRDPQAAGNMLVAEANGRGGKDNISVIVLRISDPALRPRRPN
ncbi:MAG: serine/threonine-protein phosphatase [Deltaproteobacteria bacterium]|nr:serine/threonine-protein phosphatase [Deltaproteobacteria bacterium]